MADLDMRRITPPVPVGWIAIGESGTPCQVVEVYIDSVLLKTAEGELFYARHASVKRLIRPDDFAQKNF